ncbi:MAG: GNAT family N-acetyltransferase [Desulfobulbus sp.]|nr:GNAT family N-acetyltransferase [Desulfobulbus sp.]
MNVEVATIEDSASILALQKLAYLSEAEIYNDFEIDPLTQTLDALHRDFEKQVFLKASVSGRIVGSVRGCLDHGTCLIGRLIVHPDFQGQGIGTQLMSSIESYFKTAKRYELFTGHRSERNLTLYQKLGYSTYTIEPVHENLALVFLEKHRKDS